MTKCTHKILFTCFSLLVFIACSKDSGDSCVAPKIEENIVGTWLVTSDQDDESYEVTFNEDGSLNDPEELFGDSWAIDSDGQLAASYSGGTIYYPVVSNNCNEIKLKFDFIETIHISLKRK
ncbi:hypothetical protein LAG90_09485 [Marinilongibacter aquaticus]|uniref:hypothetical protein n=1 Tax=Marinilongibacter aquaticus TaxID=2975157 RepID=UPI0021BD99EC|nr:hypothetical protein [Marinilongibacter aquaticus]UBM60864.1 hypothetical protein LAG90_09485 [Marinilongibacter aquaticus]